MTKREACVRTWCKRDNHYFPLSGDCATAKCPCGRGEQRLFAVDAIFAELAEPDEAMTGAAAEPPTDGEIWLSDVSAKLRLQAAFRAAAGGGDG